MSDRALSFLVHGNSGSGKSTFAATAPGPVLLLDVEAGARFLRGRKIKWMPEEGQEPPVNDGTWDIAVVNVHDYNTALKAYEWLKSGKHPFKSVILDSISELQAKAQESINGRQKMQTQHWGELLTRVSFFCRDLRDLTNHKVNPIEAVIVTAMTREIDGVKRPDLQGSVAGRVPYWFDICSYLFVDQAVAEDGSRKEVRKLLTAPHPQFEAKSRVPGLPEIIEVPNVSELLDNVFGPEA